MSATLVEAPSLALAHLRSGRFQRSMSALAALSSFVSGLEVAYEHYKGSYSNPVMYSPVILSGALSIAGGAATFKEGAAVRVLRAISFITLLDGVTGFYFHVRGIQRKPGGWRNPLVNIIMGPPIFAPLLFGTAAYLGFLASYLKREDDPPNLPNPYRVTWQRNLHEGRFQEHLAVVSAVWAAFSGFEAWYSHYKNRFQYWAQWTPVVLAPIHIACCVAAVFSARAGRTVLPASSALALVDGTVGFTYHVRGIVRRPGGKKTWLYNILYGPPIFAPLLFSACGVLGLLASVLGRERR